MFIGVRLGSKVCWVEICSTSVDVVCLGPTTVEVRCSPVILL
jgi:hypothetical protein